MTEAEWWSHSTTDRDVAGNLEGWQRWWNRRPGGHAHIQVSLRPSAPGASFYVDGADHEIGGHVVVPGLGLYVGSEWLAPAWLFRLLGVEPNDSDPLRGRYDRCKREVSVRFHDGGVWWTVWMNPDEWRSSDPRHRRGHLNFIDALLGRSVITREDGKTVEVLVPLPEGMRRATVAWTTFIAKRPRWPFPRRWRSATITPVKPVGIPGKGENSWDCDDDAVHSLSTDGRDEVEVVAELVESVMRTRMRRSGRIDWQDAVVDA